MHSFGKDFDALTSADIQGLITNQISEMRSLDYKQTLPGGTYEERKEFLADISSFANSGGGHIFYGITEQRGADGRGTGIPERADGIIGLNADTEILRLESSIRDGIEPRIPSVRCRAIPGFANGSVLAIEIGASWISPHMVTLQNTSRFFARGSNGKFQMDVQQIRTAMLSSDGLSKRIRDFRADRIARIVAGEEPLDGERRLIFHLIPFAAFGSELEINVTAMKARSTEIAPISSHGYNERVNLEGFRTFFTAERGDPPYSYAQFYRNGIVEAVDTVILMDDQRIPTIDLEQNLNSSLGRYLNFLRAMSVPTPFVLMITLTGVKGLKLGVFRSQIELPYSHPKTIDRDNLILPDRLIPDYRTRPDHLLRIIYDSLYNAAGWDACPHYDANGNWFNDGR